MPRNEWKFAIHLFYRKWSVIVKCARAWKWCRILRANFFDLNVRHMTYPSSFCVEPSGQLPPVSLREDPFSNACYLQVVNDLNVRRKRPQSSNSAFKVRPSQNFRGSYRSRCERCQGTNGNSPYIFSIENGLLS